MRLFGLRQRRFVRRLLAHPNARHNARVIVSLTTLPDRIANLRASLSYLLKQTRLPDEIVIVIPRFSIRQNRAYHIPDFLNSNPRIRIVRCERDWGPATKFVPVIQEELAAKRPDTRIMIVDDDRSYPRDLIETYLHFSERLPEAALCLRGMKMPRSFDWREAAVIRGDRIRTPQRVAVITGCGSYFVQPRFFHESLWDYSTAPAASFYMDDIWISGNLDRRGVEKYVVPSSGYIREIRRQRRTMTLHEVPGGRQESNNDVIAFFEDSWDVFAN